MVVNLEGKTMEISQSSSSKTERKVIEKNRRNHMKTLYSNLNSLLPNQSTKEALPLPNQIDEAINYIKSLQAKLNDLKENKERLTSRKRSYDCTKCYESTSSLRSPKLQIQEMGSSLEIALTSGPDNQFLFYEIIRILHEEGVEVTSANFSVVGNSIFSVVHAQMKESAMTFGATKITERLNRFVNGSTSEIENEPDFWDFEIHPETWGFPTLQ